MLCPPSCQPPLACSGGQRAPPVRGVGGGVARGGSGGQGFVTPGSPPSPQGTCRAWPGRGAASWKPSSPRPSSRAYESHCWEGNGPPQHKDPHSHSLQLVREGQPQLPSMNHTLGAPSPPPPCPTPPRPTAWPLTILPRGRQDGPVRLPQAPAPALHGIAISSGLSATGETFLDAE